MKARTFHQLGFPIQRIRTKENGGSEDAFKGRHQPTIFFASLLEPKGFQHLGPAAEAHGWALLLHRERSQVDRHEPVLAEGQTVGGMPSDLQQKASVPALK